MISLFFEHMFAGAWGFIWHWGIAGGIIALCLAGEVAIELMAANPLVARFLAPLQKDLLWVALVAACYLYAFTSGANVESDRCKAQQAALLNQVDRVVTQVVTAPENQPVNEKKGVPRLAPKDQWDNPGN